MSGLVYRAEATMAQRLVQLVLLLELSALPGAPLPPWYAPPPLKFILLSIVIIILEEIVYQILHYLEVD